MHQYKLRNMGSIIESHIKKWSEKILNSVPQLPDINVSSQGQNTPFRNLMVLLGIVATVKCTHSIYKSVLNSKILSFPPSSNYLKQKYGSRSWALVCSLDNNNSAYCEYLAKNKFNVCFIAPDEDEAEIYRQILSPHLQCQIKAIIIDWRQHETFMKDSQRVLDEIKDLDISVVVLPKISCQNEPLSLQPIEEQKIEVVYRHVYGLARVLIPRLKWRQYRSALIFPSSQGLDNVKNGSVAKSIAAGVDALGRILAFENQGQLDVVVARGSVQNAFIGLGRTPITY